ncbi:magnesium chelatase subunit ChlD-like protein [Paraburkholderia sacchari]|uniref:vWA domain-containing protein n=1 Tax=Paraburkholderia sacchari TaxID=159450 RepID=UPI0039A5F8AC
MPGLPGTHAAARRATPCEPGARGQRIAWPATLARKGRSPLHADHLRFVRHESADGTLHCFLLDCSASMLGGGRLARAKGLLLACFDRAAAQREEVSLISFGGGRADVRFGPAVPRWWNERWIQPVGGGGGTPFALGVATAAGLLARAKRRKPSQQRVLWVVSDARTREQPARPPAADRVVVIDCAQGAAGRGLQLARAWGADYLLPEDLVVIS